MTFSEFSNYLLRLEKTSSRLQITEILAELFKKSSLEEIDKICYLSLGQLAPRYAGLEFNLADKLMMRVISKAFAIPEKRVKQTYKRVGDLGEVGSVLAKAAIGRKTLSVLEVFTELNEIAKESGAGSVERKIGGMAGPL